MFKKFFSGDSGGGKSKTKKSASIDDSDVHRSSSDKKKKLQRSTTIAAPERSRKSSGLLDDEPVKRSEHSSGARPKQRKPDSGRASSKKKKKKKKQLDEVPDFDLDLSKPLEFPCTPDYILEYHKQKPFMSRNEEWLVVELNEFECLVENMEIINIIAKHSKFFEVDPDELWEEFFEFMEDVPSYDEVINYDVWQEFRDKKYPC